MLPAPEFRRKMRRRVLPIVAVIAVYTAAATVVERRHLETTALTGEAMPPVLDRRGLLDEARLLSSEDFQGRRTGTPGGLRARRHLVDAFAAAGLQPVKGSYLQPFGFEHRSIRALYRRDRPFRMRFDDAANVLGIVPGRDPAAGIIVVSAHYDHLGVRDGVVFPGADDNASGVAALLALARHLQSAPPRHTVLFAAFDGEELGLRGSRAFMSDRPVDGRIVLNLNLDMVGRSDESLIVVAGTAPRPFLRPVVEAASRGSRLRVRLGHDRPWWKAGMVDDWTSGSDHLPFHEAGIPFLYVGVESHPDYHQPGDTFEHMDTEFFVDAAEFTARLFRAADAAL